MNTAKGEFICHDRLTFGADCLVSWDSLFMDTDFHSIMVSPMTSPITVGEHSWIGCRAILLKGSRVPSDTVVAAGSVVSKEIEAERPLVGRVNEVLKTDIEWHY